EGIEKKISDAEAGITGPLTPRSFSAEGKRASAKPYTSPEELAAYQAYGNVKKPSVVRQAAVHAAAALPAFMVGGPLGSAITHGGLASAQWLARRGYNRRLGQ